MRLNLQLTWLLLLHVLPALLNGVLQGQECGEGGVLGVLLVVTLTRQRLIRCHARFMEPTRPGYAEGDSVSKSENKEECEEVQTRKVR